MATVPIPITNPGAETGDLTGWTPNYGPETVSSLTAATGTYSFLFPGGSAGLIRTGYIDLLALGADVAAGFSIVGRAAILTATSDTATDSYGRFDITLYDESYNYITSWSSFHWVSGGAWAVMGHTFSFGTLYPNARYVRIGVRDYLAGAQSPVYFDDISADFVGELGRRFDARLDVTTLGSVLHDTLLDVSHAVGFDTRLDVSHAVGFDTRLDVSTAGSILFDTRLIVPIERFALGSAVVGLFSRPLRGAGPDAARRHQVREYDSDGAVVVYGTGLKKTLTHRRRYRMDKATLDALAAFDAVTVGHRRRPFVWSDYEGTARTVRFGAPLRWRRIAHDRYEVEIVLEERV